jgi:hypothetical protein
MTNCEINTLLLSPPVHSSSAMANDLQKKTLFNRCFFKDAHNTHIKQVTKGNRKRILCKEKVVREIKKEEKKGNHLI